jgi:hypothetical protein
VLLLLLLLLLQWARRLIALPHTLQRCIIAHRVLRLLLRWARRLVALPLAP